MKKCLFHGALRLGDPLIKLLELRFVSSSSETSRSSGTIQTSQSSISSHPVFPDELLRVQSIPCTLYDPWEYIWPHQETTTEWCLGPPCHPSLLFLYPNTPKPNFPTILCQTEQESGCFTARHSQTHLYHECMAIVIDPLCYAKRRSRFVLGPGNKIHSSMACLVAYIADMK